MRQVWTLVLLRARGTVLFLGRLLWHRLSSLAAGSMQPLALKVHMLLRM
jgi:hypothetical protein